MHFKYKCQENWDNMKIGLHSRYCDNCKLDVIDFTKKSREEILLYLLCNQNKQICGRLLPTQLDFSHVDVLITIHGLSAKQKKSNLPFYLLTIGALVVASCKNNSTAELGVIAKQYEFAANKASITSRNKNTETDSIPDLSEKTKDEIFHPIIGLIMVEPDTSFIATDTVNNFEPDTTSAPDKPYVFAEVMPEFVGGIDSLVAFIKNNINFPEWEKENHIEGVVYVTFVVDKTGKVRNPKILRSVSGSKNFDTEVFRVISLMPDWKPGEIRNIKVDVQYNLPIRFKL